MRISDWSSDVCSSDLSSGSGWPMATERTKPLDEIDRRILHALQEDARLTIAEVAERVGLSSTPCWNRIRRLEAEEYIVGYVALLDQTKLGFPDTVIIEVTLDHHDEDTLERFGQALAEFPEVLEDRKSTRLNSSH